MNMYWKRTKNFDALDVYKNFFKIFVFLINMYTTDQLNITSNINSLKIFLLTLLNHY